MYVKQTPALPPTTGLVIVCFQADNLPVAWESNSRTCIIVEIACKNARTREKVLLYLRSCSLKVSFSRETWALFYTV